MVWLSHEAVEPKAPVVNRFVTHIEDIYNITNSIKNTNVQNIALNLSFLNNIMLKSIETQADSYTRRNTMVSHHTTKQKKTETNTANTNNTTNVGTQNNINNFNSENIQDIININNVNDISKLTANHVITLSQDTVRQINNLYTNDLLQQNSNSTQLMQSAADLVFQQHQSSEELVSEIINNVNNTLATNKTSSQVNNVNNSRSTKTKNEILREKTAVESVVDRSKLVESTRNDTVNNVVTHRPARHYNNATTIERVNNEKATIVYNENGRQDTSAHSTEQLIEKSEQNNLTKHITTEQITNNTTTGIVEIPRFHPADIVVNQHQNVQDDSVQNSLVFNAKNIKEITNTLRQEAAKAGDNTSNVNTQSINATNSATTVNRSDVFNAANMLNSINNTNITENVSSNITNSKSLRNTVTTNNEAENTTSNTTTVDVTNVNINTEHTSAPIIYAADNISVANTTDILQKHTSFSNNKIVDTKPFKTVNVTEPAGVPAVRLHHHTNNITNSDLINSKNNVFNLQTLNRFTHNSNSTGAAATNNNIAVAMSAVTALATINNISNNNLLVNADIQHVISPPSGNAAMPTSPRSTVEKIAAVEAVNMVYKQDTAEKLSTQEPQQPDDIVTIKKTKKIKTDIESETIENVSHKSTDIVSAGKSIGQASIDARLDNIPINRIADKVYKQLETRLRNERQRRGM